jgi:PPOX class probable F420-dependent enzyme
VSATRTRVHRYRDFPAISSRGLRLRARWPATPGAIGLQVGAQPLQRTTWTISLWESERDLKQFVRSQEHLDVLRPYRARMSVVGTTWETDRFILKEAWTEAHRRLEPVTEATLPWPSRFMALQYRLFKLVKHRGADDAARQDAIRADFDSLRDAKQGLIVTFKKSGQAVPAPVNVALSEGKLYFRSEPHVAKMRRLAHNDVVHVCACTVRGNPTGPVVLGRARVLAEHEQHVADRALAGNWTFGTKLMERFYDRIGVPAVYVEVTPSVNEGAGN